VTKGTKVAENLCSLDCKPITPSGGNPLCVRRERSVAARAHVFLTLPAKLLVMVADPQSSLSGRIPLDDDRNRLLAARLYHCVLLSAKLAPFRVCSDVPPFMPKSVETSSDVSVLPIPRG